MATPDHGVDPQLPGPSAPARQCRGAVASIAPAGDWLGHVGVSLQAGLIPRLFKELFQRIHDTEREQVRLLGSNVDLWAL